ncbi:MAG: hypothetical protein EAX81_08020 [Candidatus Thorarchaeota archaeon]|nr:hypothetical protein [Candidatus Thorarchaeota archaeon]
MLCRSTSRLLPKPRFAEYHSIYFGRIGCLVLAMNRKDHANQSMPLGKEASLLNKATRINFDSGWSSGSDIR